MPLDRAPSVSSFVGGRRSNTGASRSSVEPAPSTRSALDQLSASAAFVNTVATSEDERLNLIDEGHFGILACLIELRRCQHDVEVVAIVVGPIGDIPGERC